ncbi:uncharacterized protein LOC135841194 [Planococcus citri]|uniref:uncharacterized protein LOC135841178 n=1 Tax=Planococcus citri TaxID=170843 RepID=UPI0031F72797
MKTITIFIVFIVLFEGIEPAALNGCAPVNTTFCNGVNVECINGIVTINGKQYKSIKPSDKVEVTFNELKVNDKLVEKIIAAPGTGRSSFLSANPTREANGNKCPSVAKINASHIPHYCRNGQLYVDGEKIENVRPTDSVVINSNELRINGEFVRNIRDGEEKPRKNDNVINDLLGPNVLLRDNVINNRTTSPSRNFNSFNEDSFDNAVFDNAAFNDESSFSFQNNNRPGSNSSSKKRKTPRPVSPKRPRAVKNTRRSVTKTASKSAKTGDVPITTSSDDKKIYGFSGLKVICNGCNGVNSYWKGDKFYINDVEIKNCKRGDKVEINGNEVKLNGKFNTNI